MSRAEELSAHLRAHGLTADEAAYLAVHAQRWADLVDGLIKRLADTTDPRLLDVGPSLQTVLLRTEIADATVDTLGYGNPRAEPGGSERHLDFDLNEGGSLDRWPAFPDAYDAIVIGEVIEHLTVAPLSVLAGLARGLRPGGTLVIQTPNLLALHKRLRMLRGANPLGATGAVAAGSHNPGHFREYTLAELVEVGTAAGLEVDEANVANYFTRRSPLRRAYDAATAGLPSGTRQGITLWLRSPR